MKITCSIMCYNYGRFLGEAIESCLNQEPGDYELEVLVIDDGSTDNTPDICSKYSERITIIRTENRGTGPTLISTVELATGDFVCTLDADDVFEPSKLRILAEEFKRGKMFVSHNTLVIDDAGQSIRGGVGGMTSTIGFSRQHALEIMNIVPLFDELVFHLIADAGLGIYRKENLTRYRIHGSSRIDALPSKTGYFRRVNADQVARCNWLLDRPLAWFNPSDVRAARLRYLQIVSEKEIEIGLEENSRITAIVSSLNLIRWTVVRWAISKHQAKLVIKSFLFLFGIQLHKKLQSR